MDQQLPNLSVQTSAAWQVGFNSPRRLLETGGTAVQPAGHFADFCQRIPHRRTRPLTVSRLYDRRPSSRGRGW